MIFVQLSSTPFRSLSLVDFRCEGTLSHLFGFLRTVRRTVRISEATRNEAERGAGAKDEAGRGSA